MLMVRWLLRWRCATAAAAAVVVQSADDVLQPDPGRCLCLLKQSLCCVEDVLDNRFLVDMFQSWSRLLASGCVFISLSPLILARYSITSYIILLRL